MRLQGSRFRKRFALAFLLIACLAGAWAFNYRTAIVRGHSMEPALRDGQIVVVQRIERVHRPLRRDDVLLIRRGGELLIKRVYLLPDDEIPDVFPWVEKATRVNGLQNRYGVRTTRDGRGKPGQLVVPMDSVVVLGDNLRVSDDSRAFGPVPLRDVLGLVVNAPPPFYTKQ